MSGTGASTEIHELVKQRLSETETRYTAGRRVVVTEIQMASGPRTAAELATPSMGSLPVSSLYRTLAVFEDVGILKKHHGPDGVARYELAEWLTGHHHHIVCVACGAIEDIDVPDSAESELHAIASSLGAQAGFRVLDHVLEVEGVCPNCDDKR
ncbi:MAG: Fur family transcriptional regulator [Acidimicrobiia bacterium]|jgi:Fur family transcriptional regulator, ferric uptake regulator